MARKEQDQAGRDVPATADKTKRYGVGLENKQKLPGTNRDNSDNVQINYNDSYNLLGRLLTYVDATYSVKEQREAHKGIVKRTVKEWMVDLYREQYPDNPNYHF